MSVHTRHTLLLVAATAAALLWLFLLSYNTGFR
jgi:hypothetical protein